MYACVRACVRPSAILQVRLPLDFSASTPLTIPTQTEKVSQCKLTDRSHEVFFLVSI